MQVITVGQQRALCRLTAIVKGFLTRRLLTTEKVKHLRQTVLVRTTLNSVRIHANKALMVLITSLRLSFFRTRRSSFVLSAIMPLRETTNCQSKTCLCKSASEPRSHF